MNPQTSHITVFNVGERGGGGGGGVRGICIPPISMSSTNNGLSHGNFFFHIVAIGPLVGASVSH